MKGMIVRCVQGIEVIENLYNNESLSQVVQLGSCVPGILDLGCEGMRWGGTST